MSGEFISTIYGNRNSNSLIFEEYHKKSSYSELISKSRKIANILSKYRSKNVVVHVDHSILCVATILAIWQVNKTYIPVDTKLSKSKYFNVIEKIENYVEVGFGVHKSNMDIIISDNLLRTENELLHQHAKENEIAYILFTSGTTGKSKGVKITYDNLKFLFNSTRELFDFSSTDTWINLHSLEFDFSIWEIFGALLNGSNLVLPGSLSLYEFDKISKLIIDFNVNILNQTPTAFYRLQNYLQKSKDISLKYVIFGGEKLDTQRIKKSYEIFSCANFINMFGITEITVHGTFHKITKKDFDNPRWSNIGTALGNSKVILVDETRNPITKGIGEICITGSNVSVGYLNEKDLTNRVFTFNKDEVTYYSGDLGEYINGYDINYIGRKDNQIEKNGYRIELDEIKHHVQNMIGVNQCEIDYFDEKIICYVIKKDDKTLTRANCNIILKDKIPPYMMPDQYIEITEVPLTVNGKVNFKELRKIVYDKKNKGEGKTHQTNPEKWLIELFSDILNVSPEDIDIQSNFSELGLSSIMLIDIHSKILEEFNIDKDLTIVDLFQYSTIKSLLDNFELRSK